MKKRDKVIIGTVLGGAIGSVLGILFAPQSGKKTRKGLKNLKVKVYEEHGEQIDLVQKKSKNIAKKLLIAARDKLNANKKEK